MFFRALSCVYLCCIGVTLHSPPQGKDDITGEPLIQHDDDKPEALMARLRQYKEVAKPVIDLYKSVNTRGSYTRVHDNFMFTFFFTFICMLHLYDDEHI